MESSVDDVYQALLTVGFSAEICDAVKGKMLMSRGFGLHMKCVVQINARCTAIVR